MLKKALKYITNSLTKSYKFSVAIKEFENDKSDLASINKRIEVSSDALYEDCQHKFNKESVKLGNKSNIAIVATEIYETGGHTACILGFINNFYCSHNLKLFFSKKHKVYSKTYINKIDELEKIIDISGSNWKKYSNETESIITLYNQIIDNKTNILISFIHPNDVVFASVIYLIKKHTNIKTVFFNHADHLKCLAIDFFDVILNVRPNKYSNYPNSVILPLFSKSFQDTKYFSDEEIKEFRDSINVTSGNFLTLTGCASFKLFLNGDSPYFEFIKDLLDKESKIKHLVVTTLSNEEESILQNIFKGNPKLLERLIIIPSRSDFDIIFQSSDIFIDSFPQGSALSHIDAMRNKTISIIKVNKEDPSKSFEHYLPENYEYSFCEVEKMLEPTIKLLHDNKKIEEVENYLHDHFMKNFDSKAVKKKYEKFISTLENKKSVVDVLFKNLKDADEALKLKVRDWRNSENVAKFFQIDNIDLDTHKSWLESLNKEEPNNIALLIEFNEKDIGLTYFSQIDYESKHTNWGMYIYENDLRGIGIGEKTIMSSIDYARKELNLTKIYLEVLEDNHKAIKLYEKMNFKKYKELNNILFYELYL